MAIAIILGIVLFILAIVAGVVAFFMFDDGNGVGGTISVFACITLAIAFLIVPFSMHTVNSGQVAVVKRFGQVVDVKDPGMTYAFWMTNDYVKLDTKVRQVEMVTSSYSNDKQTMDINMTVQYQIKKDMAKDIVIHYGTLDMLESRIQSVAIERTKSIMSSYTADSLIEQRSVISASVADAVEAALGEAYYIDITNVALTNIDFSDAYEAAVEQKMIATQEVERAKAEALKAEETAKGELKVAEQQAEAQKVAADAEAYAKEKAAEAEAKAIQIKSLEVARMLGLTVGEGDAEMIKPDLTPEEKQLIADYLKYIEYLNTWDGKLPEVVTDGSGIIINP